MSFFIKMEARRWWQTNVRLKMALFYVRYLTILGREKRAEVEYEGVTVGNESLAGTDVEG